MATVNLMEHLKTEESDQQLEEMVSKLLIDESTKRYVVHLTLFEEEVQHMIEYITEHPMATEDELEAEVGHKTWEVTQKFRLTADERDCYRG